MNMVLALVALTIAVIGWSVTMHYNNKLRLSLKAYQDFHGNGPQELSAALGRESELHSRLEKFTVATKPPSIEWADDKRDLSEIARDEGTELWHFADVNRDLMPRWELVNIGVAAMPSHRRYSQWATFCANLTVLDRDCLESSISELESDTPAVRQHRGGF